MFALDGASRTLLAAAAFAAFGGAFVTTPIVARGEAASVAGPAPALTSRPAHVAFGDVAPRRDPFAGGDAPAARGTVVSAPATAPAPVLPALPQIPAALRPLPPNAGAGEAAFPFPPASHINAVVTAVITGPHPFALVDEGDTTRVLTVGDRIGTDTISAIRIDGVRLSGGTTLPVRPLPGGR